MNYRKPFPKIISHQGLRVNGLTNTIPAFKAAAAAGADMIEMDLHETRDGNFIIYHDNRIDRQAPPWDSLTYSRVLDLTGGDERAPKLSAVLAAAGPLPIAIAASAAIVASSLL